MADAPRGAMSSPYCQGDSMKELVKSTEYFKDATFNTEQKVENMSEAKQQEFLEQENKTKQETQKIVVDKPVPNEAVSDPAVVFQQGIKSEMMKLLMDNKIEINNVSDTRIEFTYNGGKFLILPC